MLATNEYIHIFMALIAIVNPIGAVPVFLGISDKYTLQEKKKTIKTGAIAMFVVMVVVLFIGQPILSFFSISIASFRVGGGLLILLMAIQMMRGEQPVSKLNADEKEEAELKATIGVVPLAIPTLTGPGTISSVILQAEKSSNILHFGILVGIITVISLLVFCVLSLSPKISNLLGKTGINIFTRVMGLILAATGVEFIVYGMKEMIPKLM
jgi:multiple antibiotic resistance protein